MSITKPQLRTIFLHIATFSSGMVAAISVMASSGVDLYSAYEHAYAGVKELMAAWAIIGPVAAAGYAAYRASTKNKLIDILADPKAPEVAAEIPPTKKVVEVADALRDKPQG